MAHSLCDKLPGDCQVAGWLQNACRYMNQNGSAGMNDVVPNYVPEMRNETMRMVSSHDHVTWKCVVNSLGKCKIRCE